MAAHRFYPARTFILLMAVPIYIVMTMVFAWGLPAVLISSRSDLMVVAGFAIATLWVVASICGALYIINRLRKPAKNNIVLTVEKHQ